VLNAIYFFEYLAGVKKVLGFILIVIGVCLILISILVLVKAFDVFTEMGSSSENIVYTLGSIVFPLLLTVFGRWVFRKGFELRRE
jgi:multisubunit Na+/H+ antiporter MnhG subunit